MEIEGLDYNTQRKKLLLPEYGTRNTDMVNYCVGPTNKGRAPTNVPKLLFYYG